MNTLRRTGASALSRLAQRLLDALTGSFRPLRRHRRRMTRFGARIQEAAPVKHVGATERFGAELRALSKIEVSPELVSDIETELRWGLLWYDFERRMQDEIDRVFAPYLQATQCTDFDDLRDLIGLPHLEQRTEAQLASV
jgi:hypothetical protein